MAQAATVPRIGQTATLPNGGKVIFDGKTFVPMLARDRAAGNLPQSSARQPISAAAPVIPVGKTATLPDGSKVAWDGKQFVPYNPPGYGIAEAGFREGMADLVSLPNLAGQILANPQGRRNLPKELQNLTPEQQQRVEDYQGKKRALGETIQGATLSREELLARAERNVGPASVPQNSGERIGKAIVRGGTGGLPFGPAGVAGGLLSGASAQGVTELFPGAPPWVSTLAAIGVPISAAGLLASGKRALTGTAASVWREAGKGLSPDELNAATFLHQTAVDMGSPITPAEAIAVVTNKGGAAKTLLVLQRLVESSPRGGRKLADFMAQRGAGNAAMMNRFEQSLGGKVSGQELSETAPQMQQAAEGALNKIRGEATAESRPYYAAAEGQAVIQSDLQKIIGELDATIAKTGSDKALGELNAFRKDLVDSGAIPATSAQRSVTYEGPRGKIYKTQPGTPGKPEQPVLDIGRLDSILKSWRERIDLPPISAGNLDKEVASKVGSLLKRLDVTMKSNVPEYETAKSVAQTMAKEVTGPAERSPLGRIASQKEASLEGQKAELLPQNPVGLDEKAIRFTVNQLKKQNDAAVKRFVRASLRSEFDKAARVGKRGEDATGGAGFAANIIGNSQQAKNIEALITTAYDAETYQGFKRMVDIFRAQGMREGQGSLTAYNQEAIRELSAGGVTSLAKPLGKLKEWGERFRYGYNTNKLADLFVDPAAMERLKLLLKVTPGTARERFLVGQIIGASQPRQEKE